MMKFFTQRQKKQPPRSKSRLARGLTVLLLVVALQFPTHQAHAFIVFDPITEANTLLQHFLSAAKSVIDGIRTKLLHEADKRMRQAEVDANRKNSENLQNAEINAKSVMSDATQACPLARSGAAEDALSAALDSSAAIQQALLQGRGAIGGADPGSPAARIKRNAILCQEGLREPVGSSETCRKLSGDDAIYLNSFINVDAVLKPRHTPAAPVDDGAMQYSLPKTPTVDKNGFVSFSASATGEELAFIAAWDYCESLVPPSPQGVSSKRPATSADQVYASDSNVCLATMSAASDRCFEALRYRTACPTGADFQNAGGTGCHDIQVKMCHFLKDPAPNGLGLGDAGPSLKNCDTNGLSAAEFERLSSSRCHNEGYLQTLHKDLDAPSAEHYVLTQCEDIKKAYKQERRDERADILEAIRDLKSFDKHGDCGPAPSAANQPVGTP